ncbi:hypothetical protein P8C59_008056 [Phyllachora maydis]|uniref:Uncharacterized protein n=1 Tax=Phyllachora maydis TaxID=1825666 RepID=A0AAD9IBG3_9PEZI|nr:hypothetical protein P8C59_008056 [Phyllachora maydis]
MVDRGQKSVAVAGRAHRPYRAVNKAPERSGYSFSTYLTTAAATTTTTTTSAANPATTITATRSSDISFDSPFKGLSSKESRNLAIEVYRAAYIANSSNSTPNSNSNPSKKGKNKKKGKKKASYNT